MTVLDVITEQGQGLRVWDVAVDIQYDTDIDADGVYDEYDAFPEDPAASRDGDYDGMPDDWNPNATQEQIDASTLIVDDDDDNDGIPDIDDPDPTYPNDFYAADAEFEASFGGALVQADGSLIVPAEAETINGFVNTYTDQYPMLFIYGGRIVVDAAVPSDASADLRFRFERQPYDPDDPEATEPSFETETLTVAGSEVRTHTSIFPCRERILAR